MGLRRVNRRESRRGNRREETVEQTVEPAGRRQNRKKTVALFETVEKSIEIDKNYKK